MDKAAYLKDIAVNIRANGGDCAASVRLVRDPVPIHTGIRYKHIDVELELMIPFTFAGKSLVAVSKGEYHEDVTWYCYTDFQRESHQVTAMVAALEDAIEEAEEDIFTQLMAARPTARPKRLKKKTKAVLKQLYEQ